MVNKVTEVLDWSKVEALTKNKKAKSKLEGNLISAVNYWLKQLNKAK